MPGLNLLDMIELCQLLNSKVDGDILTAPKAHKNGSWEDKTAAGGSHGDFLAIGGVGGDEFDNCHYDEKEGWIDRSVPMMMKETMGLHWQEEGCSG